MNYERVMMHDVHEIMMEDAMEQGVMDSGDTIITPERSSSPVEPNHQQQNHLRSSEQNKFGVKEHYVEPDYPRLPSEGTLEWQYTMRRTMQEIIPGLFLGPYASATRAKLDEMKAAGLTHVVCVRQSLEKNLIRPNHPDHFKYLVVEIADTTTENIIPHFRTVNKFLDECLLSGGKALVHGNAGISRSAALVIAYIMSKHGVTLKDAFSFVQSKRFCCNPNEGFMAQLREYEPIYRALHTVPLPLPGLGPSRGSLKRGLEYEDTDPSEMMPMPVVMDTSAANFHFATSGMGMPTDSTNGIAPGYRPVATGILTDRNISGGTQPPQIFSSSESSVSSSSESLPPVMTSMLNQHNPQNPHPSESPMSMS